MRRKLHRLLIVLGVFLIPFSAISSVIFTPKCALAYEKMFSFDGVGAKYILTNERKQNPNNLAPKFIELYGQFLQISLNESTAEYDKFIFQAENLIKQLDLEKQKSPYIRYFQADLHVQIAMIHGLRKSYFSAMTQLRKANNSISQNHIKYPDFAPNLKIKGIMNIILGSVPDDYNWVLSIIGVNGSVNDGLKQLNLLNQKVKTQDNLKWLTTEAFLLWNFTLLNFDEKEKILTKNDQANLSFIDSTSKNNPLLCYSLATYYQSKGENEKALKTLNSYKTPKGFQPLYFLDYMRGEVYLYKMDAKAVFYFTKYLNNFPGNYYRKSALQMIGYYYLIQNDIPKYKQYMVRVKNEGNENMEEDKKAMKLANSGEIPNKYLLKSRLLFDGGYYAEAVKVFQIHNPNIVLKTDKEFLEYHYRLGRIFHEWGNEKKALEYYNKTIQKGKNQSYYFAANAALNAGNIYEKQGQKVAAKEMYNLCLSMDFDEYHDSISQRAKAGLNRLSD